MVLGLKNNTKRGFGKIRTEEEIAAAKQKVTATRDVVGEVVGELDKIQYAVSPNTKHMFAAESHGTGLRTGASTGISSGLSTEEKQRLYMQRLQKLSRKHIDDIPERRFLRSRKPPRAIVSHCGASEVSSIGSDTRFEEHEEGKNAGKTFLLSQVAYAVSPVSSPTPEMAAPRPATPAPQVVTPASKTLYYKEVATALTKNVNSIFTEMTSCGGAAALFAVGGGGGSRDAEPRQDMQTAGRGDVVAPDPVKQEASTPGTSEQTSLTPSEELPTLPHTICIVRRDEAQSPEPPVVDAIEETLSALELHEETANVVANEPSTASRRSVSFAERELAQVEEVKEEEDDDDDDMDDVVSRMGTSLMGFTAVENRLAVEYKENKIKDPLQGRHAWMVQLPGDLRLEHPPDCTPRQSLDEVKEDDENDAISLISMTSSIPTRISQFLLDME